MATRTATADAETGAAWEYTTYAPENETCPACMRPIGSLERCKRGEWERQSGAPVVVYRHTPECPA